jgi:hypothetical protein
VGWLVRLHWSADSAGVSMPRAEWGRYVLYSIRQSVMSDLALEEGVELGPRWTLRHAWPTWRGLCPMGAAGSGAGACRRRGQTRATCRSRWRVGVRAPAAAVRRHLRGAREGVVLRVFSSRLGPDVPHRPDSFGDRLAAARGDRAVTFLHLRHFTARPTHLSPGQRPSGEHRSTDRALPGGTDVDGCRGHAR